MHPMGGKIGAAHVQVLHVRTKTAASLHVPYPSVSALATKHGFPTMWVQLARILGPLQCPLTARDALNLTEEEAVMLDAAGLLPAALEPAGRKPRASEA